MAKSMYVGIGGVARKIKQPYIGIGNVARKVKTGYVGINGVSRQFYTQYTWKKYSALSTYKWGKYNSTATTNTTYNETETAKSGEYLIESKSATVYYNVSKNSSGIYAGSGDPAKIAKNQIPAWFAFGRKSTRAYYVTGYYEVNTTFVDGGYQFRYRKYKDIKSSTSTTYSKGSYITDVTSTVSSSAYPNNARHTDGYWYVYVGVTYSANSLLGTVTSSNPNAYPTNGKHTDGYWYIKQ